LVAGLKAGDPNEALNSAVVYVSQTLSRTARAESPVGRSRRESASTAERAGSQVPGWLGYVCLGIAALVMVWVIFGLIRSATGGARGGYAGGGPGYAGGPGFGGGGGGGFFSSLLGGMFGAAAGMWMYNHFFGGGTPSVGAGDLGGAA